MKSGSLRIHSLRLSGALAAVQYTFVDLKERRREFDFLRDPEPYKYKWGAKDRVNQRLVLRR